MSTARTTPPPDGLWSVLPGSLRAALVIALTTALAAGGLLFRTDITVAPEIAQGDGPGAPILGSGDLGLSPTPSPTPFTRRGRSTAVITVPGQGTPKTVRSTDLPTFGRYVFSVEGTEQGAALTSRSMPAEMTMTIDRKAPDEESIPPLEPNQLVFSLDYGPDRQEREVVSYTPEGMVFTYESIAATIGTGSFGGETTFDPALLQIPASLEEGATQSGTTTVTGSDGSQERIEEWTARVEGREEIDVRDTTVDAWVVSLSRRTQPGTGDQFDRTRKYWFDPDSGLWVKFEESTQIREGSGLGATSYTSSLTATLTRVEPL